MECLSKSAHMRIYALQPRKTSMPRLYTNVRPKMYNGQLLLLGYQVLYIRSMSVRKLLVIQILHGTTLLLYLAILLLHELVDFEQSA